MEGLKRNVPLMITMSAIVVTLSFLLLGFNAQLNAKIEPVKENQARFESELKENQARFERRFEKLETGQAHLDKRMDGLDKRMDGIERKLDQLLALK